MDRSDGDVADGRVGVVATVEEEVTMWRIPLVLSAAVIITVMVARGKTFSLDSAWLGTVMGTWLLLELSAWGVGMRTVTCNYCGQPATRRQNEYGWIWECRTCDARVGCHRGTDRPLGTLATWELRDARVAAHAAFDAIWKSRTMTRSAAYHWLADQLGTRRTKCHIGGFDEETCLLVIAMCNDRLAQEEIEL